MYKKTIDNLSYKIYDNYAAVWKSDKNTSTVIVPTEVEGKPVTEIGDYAFAWCISLTSIIIPDSVTQIGKWAFCDCPSLTEVTIPDSITEIGYGAFGGCESLTEITISDNIQKIDKTAFENCPNIQKVKFSQALVNRTDSKKIFEQMVNAGLCTYEVIFQEPAL